MTTATLDEQARLDAEDADAFRQQVRKLADKVRKAQAHEARQRDRLLKARKECRFADNRLAALSEARDDAPAAQWIADAAKALRRVETAREAELAARQEYDRSRFARRQMQEELHALWRKQFERYPLFDAAPAGEAQRARKPEA